MRIDLGSKKVTIRKWKGKDKKAFINILKSENPDPNDVVNTLVYSCVEEDYVFSPDELRYLISRIRAYSFNEDIKIDSLCEKCLAVSKHDLKLSEIIRFRCDPIKSINVKGISIELGEIKNQQLYLNYIEEDEIFDLLLRIKSINGNDAFTLDGLIEYFDELDIDIFEEIIQTWENSKFKVLDNNVLECKECKHKEEFYFDELPNFFPESWFK